MDTTARLGFRILTSRLFGPRSRYMLYACIDRFGERVWIVSDAETWDAQCNLPAIVRQAATQDEALLGLNTRDE